MEEVAPSSVTTATAIAPPPTINHFFFAFNNPSYYPGKPVDGVLILVIHTPILVSKIGLQWRGTEFVSWYQGVSQQEHCTQLNTIFDTDYTVWPLSGETSKLYEPGTYTLRFNWTLPENSPPNFEEANFDSGAVIPVIFSASGLPRSFGEVPSYIRYSATAYVDFVFPTEDGKESQKLRMIRENSFRVVEAFDPKIIIQPPLVKKELISFFLGGSPLDLTLSLANGGVLFSGQKLFVNVFAENKSLRSVDYVTFVLVEHISLSATNPEGEPQLFDRKREVLRAAVAESQIPSGTTFNQDLVFALPAGIPGTNSTSKNIKRRYELLCEVEISFGVSPQVSVPVHILEWTPLLKEDLPKEVPVTTKSTTTTEN